MRGRHSNVMPFRSPGSAGDGWAIKLFAIIFYLFLGVMLSFLSGNPIGILSFLGLLYWVFIHRRLHRGSYFQQNRVLLIILGLIFFLLFKLESIAILILCGLYWLLVLRTHPDPPYFLRFHLLNGMIFYLFLVLGLGLVNAIMRFAFSLLMFIQPAEALAMLGLYTTGLALGTLYLFMGCAVYFAITALMGRTPYLKYITDNVRHWA